MKEAIITFNGNVRGMSETRRVGDLLQLVTRPQEAVAALQQLFRAYDDYFAAVNGYNRAQFQLYRALGFPARIVICDRPLGEVQPVEPRGRHQWRRSARTCFRGRDDRLDPLTLALVVRYTHRLGCHGQLVCPQTGHGQTSWPRHNAS